MTDELDPIHQPVAQPLADGKTPSPLGSDSRGRSPEHGLRAGAGGPEHPSRTTRPDHATRYLETTRGVLAYSEVAPLLAERVLRAEQALYAAAYAAAPLDENLLAEFHRLICHDLVPA